MTCRTIGHNATIETMYQETERIQEMMQLNNDIAMAALAFGEGRETIEGDRRQKILNFMLENEVGHVTSKQLFSLLN